MFRPVSAATMRIFSVLKSPPERVQACKFCHHAVVRELLQFIHGFIGTCRDYVARKNVRGETALHYAAIISRSLLHFPEEDRPVMPDSRNIGFIIQKLRKYLRDYGTYIHCREEFKTELLRIIFSSKCARSLEVSSP